jgi:hypothetical protein
MQTTKQTLAEVLSYVLSSEEAHFEEYLDAYGEDSEVVKNHIYNKARTLWVDFELDFLGGEK